MKTKNLLVLILLSLVAFPGMLYSQVSKTISNQWTATDGLGRKLPDINQAGDTRNGKYIGIFYWTWHTDDPAAPEAKDITQILLQDPSAASDPSNSLWQSPGQYWWSQSLFGYYRTTDDWVLRKHAEMLADAGVDAVFFDCTNGSYTWKSSYMELLKVWEQARKDGVNTPKVVFMLPFGATDGATTAINDLYTDLYGPQLYSDLWFMWNGKPLIMAYPELKYQPAQTAGMKFSAESSFSAISATCPSWGNSIGNLTFSLYKWDTSYGKSVASTPIATKTFVNFADNATLVLEFPTQPSGTYVWELKDGTESVGIWKWTDSHDAALSYYSGSQVSGNYESGISYGTSANNLTALTSGTQHTAVSILGSGVSQARIDSIKDFFTFRPGQPDYVSGPGRNDQWGWLENAPQHGYVAKTGGGFEQVTVGVAQNACDSTGGHCSAFNFPEFSDSPAAQTYGRSYTYANGQDTTSGAYLKGLNFQEQWDRANVLDPDLIFVTGWNEWTAGRFVDDWKLPMAFVDEYSSEKSRDIEPVKSWGNKGDVYYMQLISNIRKFKGMASLDTASRQQTIDVHDLSTWEDVRPQYTAYKGNVQHRNAIGQGSLVYTNNTGRNDIVGAKVARDSSYMYFYVETVDNLTDKTDPKWMRLFIDVDRDKKTGWEGYDFVVNRTSPGDSAIVEKSSDSWNWQKVGGADYVINGKTLVLKIKRSLLGITDSSSINLEFKWSDNMQEDGNIMDFYVNGDVAPGGRFNYVYTINRTDDGFLCGSNPQNINHGLVRDLYTTLPDTIPSLDHLNATSTDFPSDISMPTVSTGNFGLRYSGFVDIPSKDTYKFSIASDLSARLFIDGYLIVSSNSAEGEQAGSVNLMPGKHSFKLEYVSSQKNTNNLQVDIQSSSISKSTIPSTMLYKYNIAPSATIAFQNGQNSYCQIDSINIATNDIDGGIANVRAYDNGEILDNVSGNQIPLTGFSTGNHAVYIIATDNDGYETKSNVLNFVIDAPLALPGTIAAESFCYGNSISVINSSDTDGGYCIKSAKAGSADYYVNVPTAGAYNFTFRVPASKIALIIKLKSNDKSIGSVNVGQTGTTGWCDVTSTLNLTAGVQKLHLDFSGEVTLHRIEVTSETGSNISLKASPNPSSDDFLIQAPEAISGIIIYDLVGKVVNQTVPAANSTQVRIGSNLRPGVYFVSVTEKSGSTQRVKIIKL